MNTPTTSPLKLHGLCAAMLALAVPLAAHAMTKAEHKANDAQIEATYKADKAQCATLSGNAKDVCDDEAEGKEKVAKAENKFAYTGKPADQHKVAVAKADAAYEVSKEKCEDQTGNAKDLCEKEAKTTHVKALADAKAQGKVGEARMDAAANKRDADYKLAKEKCDALSGAAEDACEANAKAKYKP